MTAASRDGEVTVTRILRLFAHELQGMVLSLRGQSDRLLADGHPSAASIAAASAQLGALADELAHHLTPAGLQRVLVCEAVSLPGMVAEAVASLSATLAPGQRSWRIGGPPIDLWADRRGLRQVMSRVLGEAVRSTRQDDWIEISWDASQDGVTILIDDEGVGSTQPQQAAPGLDSRGIGLRLSLARALVHAHGGRMEVEAMPRVGTRVSIILPIDRLHSDPPLAADGSRSNIQNVINAGEAVDEAHCGPAAARARAVPHALMERI